MSGRPWYKRCGADFIEGTMGLSLEEKGSYSLLLDLIYSHGGPIADDDRWLAGICAVSVRKWKSLRERLIRAGKISAENGRISNARAEKELVSASETHRKLAESGAKGGSKTHENRDVKRENNGLAEAGLKQYREDKSREEEPLRGPVALPEKSSDAEVFRFGKQVLGKSAGGVIVKLRAACGYDDAYCLDLLRQASAKHDPMEWVHGAIKGTKDRPYRNVNGTFSAPQIIESREDREWRSREAEIYRNVHI